MKFALREIVFWIVLILGLVLLVWNVFGNSPTEFIALATLIFAVLLKVWNISDRVLKLEMRFNVLAKDFVKYVKK
jgi:hypothetical protein